MERGAQLGTQPGCNLEGRLGNNPGEGVEFETHADIRNRPRTTVRPSNPSSTSLPGCTRAASVRNTSRKCSRSILRR